MIGLICGQLESALPELHVLLLGQGLLPEGGPGKWEIREEEGFVQIKDFYFIN